jgi:hypothetical protein
MTDDLHTAVQQWVGSGAATTGRGDRRTADEANGQQTPSPGPSRRDQDASVPQAPSAPSRREEPASVPHVDQLPPLPDSDPWEDPPAAVPVDRLPEPALAKTEPPATRQPTWQPPQAGRSLDLDQLRGGGRDPLMVTVVLDSAGDPKRDLLRMRRVHGLLASYPGADRFAFHVYESSRRYHLEFPNSTTGYCAELHAQLVSLLGEDKVRVERLPIQ